DSDLEHEEHAPLYRHEHADLAVDEPWDRTARAPLENFGHGGGAVQLRVPAEPDGLRVAAHHDVGVEERDESGDVARSRCRNERFDDLAVSRAVGGGDRSA